MQTTYIHVEWSFQFNIDTMMYFTLGFGVLFILIAFLVHEGNARFLLSGYNTMSEEDRAAFDLNGFL